MSLEISRRDWLKGIMASAGLAAVGVPLEVIESAAPVVSQPKVRPLSIEFGDFWIRSGGKEFFIGKTSALSVQREITSHFVDDTPWLQSLPTNNVDVDASVLMDEHGVAAIHNVLSRMDVLEAFFGHHGGSSRVASAFIRSASIEMTPYVPNMLRVELSGRDGGVV